MPNMHIWCPIYLGHKVVHNANCADNAFYAGVLQCHLFRQCQLCAWDTLFLKFNFHLVNFHFLHIWHCLWHYVSLKYAKHIKYAKPKVGRGRRVHESSYGTVVAAAQCQLHFLTFHVSVVNQFQGLEPQPMRQPSKYVRYKNKTA